MLREAEEADPGEIPSRSSTAQTSRGENRNGKSRTYEPQYGMPRVRKPAEETHELLQYDLPLHQVPCLQI